MSTEIQIEGASGSRDENKISTHSVPYYVKSFDEVTTVGSADYHGLRESSRSWQAWNGGDDSHLVTVIYKGHLAEDSTTDNPSETEQWAMDFDSSEEPIESHPKLTEIINYYGGYIKDNELLFSETMPTEAKSKSSLSGKKPQSGEKNPMFGVKTFLVLTARVTRSWSVKTIPKNSVNDIGKVYKTIPDAPPDISAVDFGDRTWLAMPPKISQNGKVWRIENEWLLSPPAGWYEVIYDVTGR